MKAFVKVAMNAALAVLATGAGVLFSAAPANAAAATPAGAVKTAKTASGAKSASAAVAGLPSLVAYVRGGDVFVSRGAGETRLTTGGGISRPRWSNDGRSLAFIKGGQLWTMSSDGSSQRQLTTRGASGASWSPDSSSIAFASLSCTGGPGVYRISAAATTGTEPEVLFPSSCRGEELPEPSADVVPAGRSLNDRLKTDDAVAFSPDGAKVAFRGGDCEDVYDSCLSIGTVATGDEETVAAFGGGSLENSGFAVVPSWRADGAKLSFTAYQQGETVADDQPVHLVEYDTATGAERTVGGTLDREMAYLDAARGVATGQYRDRSWVVMVDLVTGAETPLHAGSQPSVQPLQK
jgi:TolB protein